MNDNEENMMTEQAEVENANATQNAKRIAENAKRQVKNAEKEAMKKLIKKIIIASLKPIAIAIAVVFVLGIVLSATKYFLDLFEGTKQTENNANLPYVSDTSEDAIEIDPDGTIHTGMTAEEMWDLLVENEATVTKYLDNADELKKLIYAELITKYLDTRPDPDAPIDWKSIYSDPSSDKLQGISKMKRSINGEMVTMIYTDPETFQANMDAYNASGSEADKLHALKYFTLEQVGNQTQFEETEKTDNTEPKNVGKTEKNTNNLSIVNNNGIKIASKESVTTGGTNSSEGRDDLMYFPADGKVSSHFGYRGPVYNVPSATRDHKGIDINVASGTPVHATDGGTVIYKGYNGSAGNEVMLYHGTGEGYVEGEQTNQYWYRGDGYYSVYMHLSAYDANLSVGDAVSKGDEIALSGKSGDVSGGGEYAPHLHFGIFYMKKEEDGTVTMMWVNPETFLYSNAPDNFRDNGELTIGSNIEGPPRDPYYIGGGGSGGGSGGSGGGSGDWIGDLDGEGEEWEMNPEEQDSAESRRYYAKVATWNKTVNTMESNDPGVQSSEAHEYNMEAVIIDFQTLLMPFTMPLEFLWDFLLVGQEKDFVLDLADQVYESEIEISILDNTLNDTTVTTNTYQIRGDVETTVTVSGYWENQTFISEPTEDDPKAGRWETYGGPVSGGGTATGKVMYPSESASYQTVQTDIIETNVIDAIVTKADIWIAKYTREYSPKIEVVNNVTPIDNSELNVGSETTSSDPANLAPGVVSSVKGRYPGTVTITSVTTESKIEYFKTNWTTKIDNTVTRVKPLVKDPVIIEKTDPNSDKPNFVTLFRDLKYTQTAANLNSARMWILDMLSKSPTTADMVDLTDYLLTISADSDYVYVESENNIFNPEDFAATGVGGSTDNIDGIGGVGGMTFEDFIAGKQETFTTVSEQLLWAADQVHTFQKDWHYDTNFLWEKDIEKSLNNIDKCTSSPTYVATALYVAKVLTEGQLNSFDYNSANEMWFYLKDTCGWEGIANSNYIEPGDIVFLNYDNGGDVFDEVLIYAGDATWFSAGSTNDIRAVSPYFDEEPTNRTFFLGAFRPTL